MWRKRRTSDRHRFHICRELSFGGVRRYWELWRRRKCEMTEMSFWSIIANDFPPEEMRLVDVEVQLQCSRDEPAKMIKTVKLSDTMTFGCLKSEVASCISNFDEVDLDLILKDTGGIGSTWVPFNSHRLCTLVSQVVDIHKPGSKWIILIRPINNSIVHLAKVNDVEDNLILGASASPTTGEETSKELNKLCQITEYDKKNNVLALPAPPIHDENAITKDEPMAVVEAINYVGLVNQAMTCYLNSLVQALYMTPEFRNAIYNWEFDGQNETRSIPYQLQKLFLNLQTSNRAAVETTDLTTSFGWQGSEAWHQHDIQELCRVMFDALERKFKDTKQANLINDLYMGTWLDYVKCLECGTEKSREDTFLDIPLPVRPFGSNVAYNSVEEALRAFVQPETLDGNNQYYCEKCTKKCNAHKGLKFIKFPYLLTLHLKRFDFDYVTMHRIKLNDKVVFPEKLNLNSFVPSSRSENEHLEERESAVKCDDCSTTDSGSALDDESGQGTDVSSAVNDNDCEDSDEGIDVSSGNNHRESEAKGPYVYELFSIMIHSGSASGGHYYAYIKDFEKNYWLSFNDQTVSRITQEDIKKTFGGGIQKGYYSGMYSSSTNAYMLMYRQIDKDRNSNAMKVEEFPPHMKKLLELMKNQEVNERARKEIQNNSCKLTVYCQHPITDELVDVRINSYMDATLEQAVDLAHRRLKLDGIVDAQDCRLVLYNKDHACIDTSFESPDVKLCDIEDTVYYTDWFLEIREPGTEFETYKKGGIFMKVYQVLLDTEEINEPVQVRVDVGDTVKDLKNNIAKLLNMDSSSMKVVLEKTYNELKLLADDRCVLPLEKICPEFKLYVCNALDEDPAKEFDQCKLKKVVDKFEFVVHVNILLPDTEAATLDAMYIPTLDMDKCDLLSETNTENSPNLRVSPQPVTTNVDSLGDQSNSEDSSLSDSDRTLVGDTPEYQGIFSSSSDSPADQHMTSPSEMPENDDMLICGDMMGASNNVPEKMNWDQTRVSNSLVCSHSYFKVTSIRECRRNIGDTNYLRQCKVFLENRMTLYMLKKYLEPVVRVPKEHFKIYRQYPSPDEEWTNLSDTLVHIRDNQTLTVKLGRALSSNEYSCKVYLLRPESMDTQFLFEHILCKGQTVAQVKKEVLFKAKKQHMLDIPFNKCRLREKCLKRPRKVYLDDQVFLDHIIVSKNNEMFLQELSEPETVTCNSQLVMFARQWCPSTYTLTPYVEVVLDNPYMSELKEKVSEISGIPIDNVEIAFVKPIFPCDMHLLEIHTSSDWNKDIVQLDQWPLHADHGTSFFYRDNREKLKELSAEDRKDLNIKENARLGRYSTKSHSPWESSLRIYTEWPPELEDNCID